MYARADAQLDASRTTNLRAANVCLVAGIKDACSSSLLSSPLHSAPLRSFPLPCLISSQAGRSRMRAGPRCLCSILRKLCRNSALVLYLLRRALSHALPLPLPVPASLHLVSFYGAIKLRSRVTTHQTTILCLVDVFMTAIARHRPNGRAMNPPPK